MRILRLQIHELGRHRELDLELAPGFTVVRGPNESGKSTIQRALELALFRKPTATAGELDTLRTWGCAEGDRSSVRLEFLAEDEDPESGETVTTPGVLEKEYRGARGRVRLELGGEAVTDPARADQLLAGISGIPSEAFFRSTASIRHEELEDLDRDEGALRDRLQASIGGGDRGSSQAKRRLEEAIRGLRAKGERNPGRLKTAEQAVAQAEVAVRAGESALARLEHDRDELAGARALRSRVEGELAESRSLLETARQAERLRWDQSVVTDRYERLRQAVEAQRRLTELEAMPDRSLAELRDGVERLRAMQGRVALLQETMREETAEDGERDEPEPGYRRLAVLTAAMLIVAAVALGSAIRDGAQPGLAMIGGILLGIAGLALLGLTFTRYTKARSAGEANRAREQSRALSRQRRVGAEEGLRVALGSVQRLLQDLGVPDAGVAERIYADEQTRRQEMATLRVQVKALLVGTTPEKLVEQRDQAALELEQKTAALAALGPIAHEARARERLEAEVREREETFERARDAEASAAARVDANQVDAEQVAAEAERLATWREQLAALRRRVLVYETTLEAIQSAEREAMRKATHFLEQHMARDVARLTGDRYCQVRVDDASLDIEVWSPEKADWVSANRLSKGTLDQIYLAARIGLVRLVTEGRRPPLILDDPFVTFDDARAARAALLLQELSRDFQVVYLTCSDRYDELADAVVALPGPDAVGAAAPLAVGA